MTTDSDKSTPLHILASLAELERLADRENVRQLQSRREQFIAERQQAIEHHLETVRAMLARINASVRQAGEEGGFAVREVTEEIFLEMLAKYADDEDRILKSISDYAAGGNL